MECAFTLITELQDHNGPCNFGYRASGNGQN